MRVLCGLISLLIVYETALSVTMDGLQLPSKQAGAPTVQKKTHDIGNLHLTDLPKEPLRTKRVRVECHIDANGMVSVTVTDKVSGKSQSASLGSCEHQSRDASPSRT